MQRRRFIGGASLALPLLGAAGAAGAGPTSSLAASAGIVDLDEEGIVGDGTTNVTAALQALLNASVGKLVLLGTNKIYGITSLTIPAGSVIVAKRSEFRKLAASSTYGLTVQGDVQADRLALTVVGASVEAGIRISGSDVAIGEVVVMSESANAGSGAALNGLFVNNTSVPVANIHLGSVSIYEFAAPMRAMDVDNLRVDRITIRNFRVGIYLIDVRDSSLSCASITGLSPTSVGGPGDNGFLVEATRHHGTSNLTLRDCHVADAGEHGFRVGGQFTVSNFWAIGCSSIRSGAAGAAATGGGGFKVLGGYQNGSYHLNIHLVGCVAEDCSTTGTGIGNFCAFQLGTVKHGRLTDCVVAARDNPYSCWWGASVLSCEDIQISNPDFTRCRQHAIRFCVADPQTTPPYPMLMKDVIVRGGILDVDSSVSAVVRFEPKDSTFDNVGLEGACTVRRGGQAVLHVAPIGAGAYRNCSCDIVYLDPQATAGAPPIQNQNDIFYRYRGPYYGAYLPQAAPGSTMQDPASGNFRLKRLTGWSTL